jgi:hypothetical protein
MRRWFADVPPIVATDANVADPLLVGAFGVRLAVVVLIAITTTFPWATSEGKEKFQVVRALPTVRWASWTT